MLLLLYIASCFFVGWIATLRGQNIFLFTLLSLAITPIITLLIMLFLIPPAAVGSRTLKVSCPKCSHELKHLKSIEYCSHCGVPL